MLLARPARQTWLTLLEPGTVRDFDGVARAAGLQPLGRAWVKVDARRAREILASVLQMDLAYQGEVMPRHRAERFRKGSMRGVNDVLCGLVRLPVSLGDRAGFGARASPPAPADYYEDEPDRDCGNRAGDDRRGEGKSGQGGADQVGQAAGVNRPDSAANP